MLKSIYKNSLEPVISHGKRDFVDVIMLRILRWEDYPRLCNIITGVLIRGRQEGQSQRRRCDDGSRGCSDVL